ncbi:MAG TPA: hypothetical protein VN864_06935 [Thermoplasmata archaeon]|nr:hypothetical protein [Thermoplasmata archaeon]
MPTSDRRRTPLLPATVAGLALLLVGLIVLLIGGSLAGTNRAEVDFWLVGTGLLVLLGAVLATLFTDRAPRVEPAAAPVGPPGPPAVPAARPVSDPTGGIPDDDRPSAWVPSMARPTGAYPVSSSIAAQFEGPPHGTAMGDMGFAPWDEGAGSGMSLPFSAIRSSDEGPGPPYAGVEDDSEFPSAEYLQQEVERLREKVRAFQHPEFRPAVRTESSPVLAPPAPRSGPRPPEPPSPGLRTLGRSCTGCGSGLPGGATDPLCWGCGRPLCATCYWRTKEGAAAHTCPACYARASGTNTSSVRGPAPTPTAVPVRAATPRR